VTDHQSARTYGQRVAADYDRLHPQVLTTDAAVERLAELAGEGPVLELGVGTGRLAIPLAARGLAVTGVDIAAAMLEQLAAKPGGERVESVLGDFAELGDLADLGLPTSYRLVVVAADTFFLLTSQERQVRCVASVAEHLHPDGCFVVEAFVPDRARATAGGVAVRKVTEDSVVLGASTHDPAQQRIDGAQIIIDAAGIRFAPATMRYAWPSELDLMARLAGLRLRERHGGWQREEYTSASPRHVSVYEPA
jgi:SAM-dependent methyltransferase